MDIDKVVKEALTELDMEDDGVDIDTAEDIPEEALNNIYQILDYQSYGDISPEEALDEIADVVRQFYGVKVASGNEEAVEEVGRGSVDNAKSYIILNTQWTKDRLVDMLSEIKKGDYETAITRLEEAEEHLSTIKDVIKNNLDWD